MTSNTEFSALGTTARVAQRQRLMRVCSKATPAEIAEALGTLGRLPDAHDLRRPEIGLVMLRGRIGGDGSAFNLGEATVARAVVRLETGTVGFGWRLGRSIEAARLTAVTDALLQDRSWEQKIMANVLQPLEARQTSMRTARAEETAATRVEFFTLARGSE